MQHKQFNFVRLGTKIAVLAFSFLMAGPALAGTITQPSKPDPLLDGGPTDPCAAGADYAAGIDSNGKPVIPADVAAGRVPLPDTVAIPLGTNRARSSQSVVPGQGRGRGPQTGPIPSDNASDRDSTYVALDGRKLEPLLNPAPCGAVR